MADTSTLITGPASTDNNTVILWAVAVLLAFGVSAVAWILSRVAANEKKCAERAALDQKAIEDRDKKIVSMYEGVIADVTRTSVQNASAMSKVADAVDNLATIVQAHMTDEETRAHTRKRS